MESDGFIKSLANSTGVLCNAGFETPSEALYLGKKLCVIPMKNQYEQACNAEMLKNMGIPVLQKLSAASIDQIRKWTSEGQTLSVNYPDNVPGVVEQVMAMAEAHEFVAQKRKVPRLIGAFGG